MILIDENCKKFKDFPKSAYIARNSLEIEKQYKTYTVCLSCNLLYNVTEILA